MPTHDYRLRDGTRVSGVTTIISSNLGWNKQALLSWSWREGKEGRDFRKTRADAADIGTMVHAMVEADLKEETIPIPPVEMRGVADASFAAFQDFKRSTDLKTVSVEVPLVSEKHRYGGTIDRVVMANGKLCILDLKTSKDIYEDMKIQIRAYGELWAENNPDRPVECYYILKLSKTDGGFSWTSYPNLDKYWELFLLLLRVNEFKRELRG